jgi:anaerobic selenocysteine-containing dehydrogenase
VFLTPSEKAEFSAPPLPDVVPPPGRLTLSTVRSHDQWNTTIYSDDDRYRGLKNLRTALFMNAEDMRDRGLAEFDLIDITSFARDGSTRSVYGYRAVAYNTPRGSVFGYMPELNVLCAIADHSGQSGQPLTKQLIVEVTPAGAAPDPHLTAAHDR